MNIQNAFDAPAAAAPNEHDEAFSHDDVARVAKQIWEDEGCPDGKSEEHWQQAEAHLRNGHAKPAASSP